MRRALSPFLLRRQIKVRQYPKAGTQSDELCVAFAGAALRIKKRPCENAGRLRAGLPDVRNKKVVKDGKNETVIVSDEDDDEDEIDPENLPKKNECPNCFSKVSPTDNVCPNCGFKLKK